LSILDVVVVVVVVDVFLLFGVVLSSKCK